MIGTLFNVSTVILGGLIGAFLKEKLPKNKDYVVLNSVGLFTLCLGIVMCIDIKNPIAVVFGLLVGNIIGDFLDLEGRLNLLAEKIKARVGGEESFVKGMMTAFITFCVGPMTVIGSINDGLGDPSILITKSVMDGFVATAYSAAMGIGVVFSIIPMLFYQGSITLLAESIKPFLTDNILGDLSGTGGTLMLGLGLSLLRIKDVKVVNMLPSLLLTPLLSVLTTYLL